VDAPTGEPDLVLIATGSEVTLAIKAKEILSGQGVSVRVVSMPSTTVFDRQDLAYRRSVLPDGVKRIAIEAGATALSGGNMSGSTELSLAWTASASRHPPVHYFRISVSQLNGLPKRQGCWSTACMGSLEQRLKAGSWSMHAGDGAKCHG
jgi:transketolase